MIRMAKELAADDAWMGTPDPRSTLRALNKYFWWSGGG
jgi:hypothetical protein